LVIFFFFEDAELFERCMDHLVFMCSHFAYGMIDMKCMAHLVFGAHFGFLLLEVHVYIVLLCTHFAGYCIA
jgi:hypothetical protein